ncbi:MAG: PepSY domain-containing protein [Thermoanaerobaculia bacterium]|nr:PepSY domain-containing protein [Thermoanaerobaculia bacterium]
MKRLGPLRLRNRTVSLAFDIHSWLGILGCLALFVCCFSGSLALFEQELVAWERPATRVDSDAEGLSVDQLLEVARQHLGAEKDMFVILPTPHSGGMQVRAFGDGKVEKVFLDPTSGAVVEAEHETAFEFLTHLHTDLHLPRPFGRYLVGFLGIFLLMSLITGVMTHTKVIKDLFLLRWRPRRLRLTFSDLHKQLGVWGLLFGFVMASTGAVLGLLGLFAPVMVLSAFGGDVDKATEAFSGPRFEATGSRAEMLSVDSMIDDLEGRIPGTEVSSFFLRHWEDEAAEIALNLDQAPHRKLVAGETHRLSLVDGSTLHMSRFTERGAGSRLFGAMQPVHYALFGGLAAKLLYFLLGVALSLGIATGAMIWLERRRPAAAEQRERRDRTFWLGRIHLGVSLGLVLSSALALAAGRIAPPFVEATFWTAWLAIFVGAFFVPSSLVALRAGGFLTAAVLVAVASYDLLASPVLPLAAKNVDIALLTLAGLVAAASALIPKRARDSRNVDSQSQPAEALPEPT